MTTVNYIFILRPPVLNLWPMEPYETDAIADLVLCGYSGTKYGLFEPAVKPLPNKPPAALNAAGHTFYFFAYEFI